MKSILLIFAFFSVLSGETQSRSSTDVWHITARSVNASVGFNIDLYTTAKEYKIVYRRLDSTSKHLLEKDPTYVELRASIKNSTSIEEVELLAYKLGEIADRYTVYTSDSLKLLNEELAFTRMLDTLNQTNVGLLTVQTNVNGISEILSGYSFHFVKQNGRKKVKDFQVQSPGPFSYPILFRFISGVLDLYRNAKPHSFLDKQHTGGY